MAAWSGNPAKTDHDTVSVTGVKYFSAPNIAPSRNSSRPAVGIDIIGDRFRALSAQWKSETKNVSSFTTIWMNPAYQEIIGMGPAVLPLLFDELRRKPDWWFWALRCITRQNPVPKESRGSLRAMTQYWLQWGDRNGYVGPDGQRVSSSGG